MIALEFCLPNMLILCLDHFFQVDPIYCSLVHLPLLFSKAPLVVLSRRTVRPRVVRSWDPRL